MIVDAPVIVAVHVNRNDPGPGLRGELEDRGANRLTGNVRSVVTRSGSSRSAEARIVGGPVHVNRTDPGSGLRTSLTPSRLTSTAVNPLGELEARGAIRLTGNVRSVVTRTGSSRGAEARIVGGPVQVHGHDHGIVHVAGLS